MISRAVLVSIWLHHHQESQLTLWSHLILLVLCYPTALQALLNLFFPPALPDHLSPLPSPGSTALLLLPDCPTHLALPDLISPGSTGPPHIPGSSGSLISPGSTGMPHTPGSTGPPHTPGSSGSLTSPSSTRLPHTPGSTGPL